MKNIEKEFKIKLKVKNIFKFIITTCLVIAFAVSMIIVFNLSGWRPVVLPAEEVAAEEPVVEEVTGEPEEALDDSEEEELFLLDNINSGMEGTYTVIYEVPKDSKDFILEITNLEWTSDKAYISLGFWTVRINGGE